MFHFFSDFGIVPEIEREVRKHYKGNLVLAQDFMVFNVKTDDIVVRMAVTPTHVLPIKERHMTLQPASTHRPPQMSRWLAEKQLFPKF